MTRRTLREESRLSCPNTQSSRQTDRAREAARAGTLPIPLCPPLTKRPAARSKSAQLNFKSITVDMRVLRNRCGGSGAGFWRSPPGRATRWRLAAAAPDAGAVCGAYPGRGRMRGRLLALAAGSGCADQPAWPVDPLQSNVRAQRLGAPWPYVHLPSAQAATSRRAATQIRGMRRQSTRSAISSIERARDCDSRHPPPTRRQSICTHAL